MLIILETVLKGLERVAIPDRILLFENLERSLALVVLPEVGFRGVVGDELLTKLAHREGCAIVFEARDKLAIGAEEQVLALLLEVVFTELIHHTNILQEP